MIIVQKDQYIVHSELEMRHWWFLGRRAIIGDLVHFLVPPGKEHTITDMGCGTGGNIAGFAGEYTAFGIDASREAMNFAEKHMSDVVFTHNDAGDDLNKDARAILQKSDIILLMDVLEHVIDDSGMLTKICRSARAGTHIILTVPADMGLWSEHDVSFGHHRRYDRSGFRSLWSEPSVSELLLSYFNARLYPFVRLKRTMNRIKKSTDGLAGTDLKMNNRLVNYLLRKIFSGESGVLTGVLSGTRASGYKRGASLVAVLRCE